LKHKDLFNIIVEQRFDRVKNAVYLYVKIKYFSTSPEIHYIRKSPKM